MSRLFKHPFYFALLIFIIQSNRAIGEIQTLSIQNDTLKEVTVTSKQIVPKSKSVNPVQIFNKAGLEKQNSLNVADAVRHFAGVQLKDYGGIGGLKTINVRSLGANHTGVLYDGIPLGNAQNGQIDLSKFSLDNIEAIELYNGENSGQLQTARALSSASSLYLISRVPIFTATEKTHGKLSFKTGSFGLVNPSLLVQQRISKNTYTSFNTEWQKANGRYSYQSSLQQNETLDRTNGDISALRVEAGLNGMLRDSSEWVFKIFSYKSERGLPAAAILNNFGSARLWDSDLFFQSTYKKAISKVFQLMLNAKFSEGKTHYLDPNFAGSSIDNRYSQNEYYLSAAAEYQLTSYWKASVATDFSLNQMDANIARFADPSRSTSLISFITQLNFSHLALNGSLLSTILNEKVKVGNTALNKQILSPALSAVWSPGHSNFALRGFYKNIFRMPTFNDLYYTNIGNVNLKPEYTQQFDLGVTYVKAYSGVFQSLNLNIDGYLNQVNDKIVAIPNGNLFQWSMINLGRVKIYGLETGAKTNMKFSSTASLAFGLNYTYQKALDVTPNSANYGDLIPYTPQHTGSAALSLAINNYTFNYNYMYTGNRYSLRPNFRENYMQPWYTHDVSGSRTLAAGKLTYKVQAEISNLLNLQYDVVRNYPMPGRSYRMNFTMNF